MSDYLIKTARTGLRLLRADDISYLEILDGDEDVRQHFPAGPASREEVKAMIDKFMGYYAQRGLPCFMVFELDTGEFMGRAGFGPTEENEIEVGYVYHKKFWGKGYASEILQALIAWAKLNIPVESIIAYADVANTGSWRVMEKCGMIYYKNDLAKGMECKFYRAVLSH